MNEKKTAEPHDLILDHLRAIRAEQATQGRKIDTMQADILNVRKDLHGLQGELLRFEESLAAMGAQIDRVNTRLGLNETPQ